MLCADWWRGDSVISGGVDSKLCVSSGVSIQWGRNMDTSLNIYSLQFSLFPFLSPLSNTNLHLVLAFVYNSMLASLYDPSIRYDWAIVSLKICRKVFVCSSEVQVKKIVYAKYLLTFWAFSFVPSTKCLFHLSSSTRKICLIFQLNRSVMIDLQPKDV